MLYKNYATSVLNDLKIAIDKHMPDFVELVKFPKNSLLLSPGQRNLYYYVVQSGVLVNYYMRDGEEVVTSFTFPDDIVADFRTAVFKVTSTDYIKTLSPVKVYRISVSDFDKLKKDNNLLVELERQLIIAYALLLEERLRFIQHTTALERYKFLMDNYPQFIATVSTRYIASYIGVKVETLSRIRSKI
ncbi:Cyclic nucleotide-binding domain protein [compost metagenome]